MAVRSPVGPDLGPRTVSGCGARDAAGSSACPRDRSGVGGGAVGECPWGANGAMKLWELRSVALPVGLAVNPIGAKGPRG